MRNRSVRPQNPRPACARAPHQSVLFRNRALPHCRDAMPCIIVSRLTRERAVEARVGAPSVSTSPLLSVLPLAPDCPRPGRRAGATEEAGPATEAPATPSEPELGACARVRRPRGAPSPCRVCGTLPAAAVCLCSADCDSRLSGRAGQRLVFKRGREHIGQERRGAGGGNARSTSAATAVGGQWGVTHHSWHPRRRLRPSSPSRRVRRLVRGAGRR